MSLNKSEQSLHIEPRRSRHLALTLLLIHGAAMGVVLTLAIPVWLLLGLAGSVIALLVGSWHVYVNGESKKSIRLMVWNEEGDWEVMTSENKMLQAMLLPGSYVFEKFMILRFAAEDKRKYSTILMSDSLPPRLFHRLFLRLKFEGGY